MAGWLLMIFCSYSDSYFHTITEYTDFPLLCKDDIHRLQLLGICGGEGGERGDVMVKSANTD